MKMMFGFRASCGTPTASMTRRIERLFISTLINSAACPGVLAYFRQLTKPNQLYRGSNETSMVQGATLMRALTLTALFALCLAAAAQEKKRTGVPPVEDSLKAM